MDKRLDCWITWISKNTRQKRMGNYGNCRLNAPPVFEDINSVSWVLTGLCQLSRSVTGSTDFLMSVDSLRHSTSTGTKHHRKYGLVMVVYGSISCPLVKLDRPTIKSPGLMTLDYWSCAYCKTTYFTPWFDAAANWGKVSETVGDFWTRTQLLLSSSLLTAA